MVDVLTEINIDRQVAAVANYAGNPMNAPKWYVNIKSAEWQGEPELKKGAQIAFHAHFMGKKLEYTYEIIEYVPGEKLVMHTAEGPFPMETTYTWEPVNEAQTKMTLRNRGEPKGFSKLFAPFMAMGMRRATNKDLKLLKKIMEEGEG